MKTLITIIIALSLACGLQCTAQQAVNSAYASGNGCEFSLGETFVGEIGNGKTLVAGVLQGEIILSASGVNDVSTDKHDTFRIYPNPVETTLNIEYTGNINGEKRIIIYANNGNEVFSHKIKANKTAIDISHIAAGLYIVKIASTDGNQYTTTTKLIKK